MYVCNEILLFSSALLTLTPSPAPTETLFPTLSSPALMWQCMREYLCVHVHTGIRVHVLCEHVFMCTTEFSQGFLHDHGWDVIYLSLGNFVVSDTTEENDIWGDRRLDLWEEEPTVECIPELTVPYCPAQNPTDLLFHCSCWFIHGNKYFSHLLATSTSFFGCGFLLWMCFLSAVFT